MPKPARLRVISWNVHVSNRRIRSGILLLAALFRPHVIALQEARNFDRSIPGYKRLAADGTHRKDADQNLLLVRRGLRIVKHGPLNVPGKGWTYDGTPKPPRTFYGAAVVKGGLSWHVLNVHRCVGGPRGNSPEEWWAEDDVIERWASIVPDDQPTIVVGDHNDRGEHRRPGTVTFLADCIDARILTPGGIDYALVRDCGGIIRRLARSFGSDHPPVFITLRAHRRPPVRGRNIPLP